MQANSLNFSEALVHLVDERLIGPYSVQPQSSVATIAWPRRSVGIACEQRTDRPPLSRIRLAPCTRFHAACAVIPRLFPDRC